MDVVSRVQQMSHLGGIPNLNQALQLTFNQIWSESSDDRIKFLFLIPYSDAPVSVCSDYGNLYTTSNVTNPTIPKNYSDF